jgi:hypothetical protein
MSAKIVIVVVAIVVIAGLAWFMLNQTAAPTTSNVPQATPVAQQNDRSINVTAPTATPISKQVPVTIITSRGTVEKVDQSSLSLKTATETVNVTFEDNVDVQRLTSGTLEKGDGKTAPAKLTDIAVGQEVMAVINKGTSKARSLLIIR